MEKAENVLVATGDFGWDDVGSWSAVERHFRPDPSGNTLVGDATAVDSSGSVLVAEGADIAVIGVKDVVVVTTKGHVLVAAKDRVQDLKKLVGALDAPGRGRRKK